ncbi:MAG: class I SAM-dependent methyltransferase [Methylovulum sp.]|nr:class I SAM-dependent methyltransferase [Methylovulum sp.]
MTEPDKDAADFFDTWVIYRSIVAHNNMFHREIYADVAEFLAGLGDGFSMLDLGCGDAACLAPVLAGAAIMEYRGVDLSETALQLAAKNLAALPCPVSLQQTDLLQALHENPTQYDVIFSSFAVHHLSLPQKTAFFRAAHSRLNHNGRLLLIDTVRAEGEDLPAYLHAYCQWIDKDWIGITPEEKAVACEHIMEYDFPENMSTLSAISAQAGFTSCCQLNQYRWHRVLCFQSV